MFTPKYSVLLQNGCGYGYRLAWPVRKQLLLRLKRLGQAGKPSAGMLCEETPPRIKRKIQRWNGN